MRSLLASFLLFVAAATAPAQIVVAPSLQALGFLRGVWVPENRGRGEMTEFHWGVADGRMVLAGRHWTDQIQTCPACNWQTAMVAYVDRASDQVYARFDDKTLGALQLKLMLADGKSAEFVSVDALGTPTYRLRYKLISGDVLSVARTRIDELRSCILGRRALDLEPAAVNCARKCRSLRRRVCGCGDIGLKTLSIARRCGPTRVSLVI